MLDPCHYPLTALLLAAECKCHTREFRSVAIQEFNKLQLVRYAANGIPIVGMVTLSLG